ncbi:MAG: hypothetical protein JXR19_06280 [Bacteroidia bacterium]
MKIKSINLIFTLFVALLLASCTINKDNTESEKTGIEYTSTYVCPMHCEGSGSEEEGICPVCEMDYVLNEDEQHEHDSSNHQH